MTTATLASPLLAAGRLLGLIRGRAARAAPEERAAPRPDPADPFGFDAPPVLMRAFDDCLTRAD